MYGSYGLLLGSLVLDVRLVGEVYSDSGVLTLFCYVVVAFRCASLHSAGVNPVTSLNLFCR